MQLSHQPREDMVSRSLPPLITLPWPCSRFFHLVPKIWYSEFNTDFGLPSGTKGKEFNTDFQIWLTVVGYRRHPDFIIQDAILLACELRTGPETINNIHFVAVEVTI